jgi:hypothetical protein
MVHSVMEQLRSLSDARFLLAHAREVLPAEPSEVDGSVVYNECVLLRRKLAEERAAAITALVASLQGRYPDREPAEVRTMDERGLGVRECW